MSPPLDQQPYISPEMLVVPQIGAKRLPGGGQIALAVGRVRAHSLAVLCILFFASVAVQIAAGAYSGERGNYSDEASHFLNGLLVRDYVRDGLGQSPIAFAEEYYLSYPKIAPGMWPPLFDLTLGIFTLPGWPPFTTALLLLAGAMAWTAWRLYSIVTLTRSPLAGVMCATLFVLTPVIDDMTTAVMLDVVVAAFALEAAYWLAVFLRTERWRHGVLFGVFTAFCCLTKGNGVAVVIVPLFLLLLTQQWRLLRHPALYVAAAIVVLFAVPALAYSYRLDAAIGDFGPTRVGDAIGRVRFYGWFMREQLGILALIAAAVAVLRSIRIFRGEISDRLAFEAAMASLALGALTFHVLNPHVVIAGRYMALAVAPLLALMPAGIDAVSNLGPRRMRKAAQGALLAAVVITFFWGRPAMASRMPLGFRQTAELLQDRGLDGRKVLVVSDENGEGAFVADVAVRHLSPAPTVIRVSKLIASDDWGGHNFRLLFESANHLMRELEDLHVDYIVVDRSKTPPQYAGQVEEMIADHSDRLEKINEVRAGRSITTYRLKYRSAGRPKPLQIALTYSLGRTLQR